MITYTWRKISTTSLVKKLQKTFTSVFSNKNIWNKQLEN